MPRLLAGLVSTVLLAAGIVFAASAPATAEVSPPPTAVRGPNTLYAYVGPGENLDVAFTLVNNPPAEGATSVTITVRGPGGVERSCTRPALETVGGGCSWSDLTAGAPGIWQIDFTPNGTVASAYRNVYDWDINVQDGAANIPGRVYADQYNMTQAGTSTWTTDFSLWYVSEQGFRYQADYEGYNGVDSTLRSDAAGVAVLDSCVSAYRSIDVGGPSNDSADYGVNDPGECGDPYKLFFNDPAASLPATATLWDGTTVWLRPEVVLPEVSGLRFTRDSATTSAGEFSFETANFVGQLEVLVDANNDGDYSDPEDRRIPGAVTADGTTTVPFDGLDGLGNPIPSGMPMGARVEITQAGEIHFMNGDVETRTSLSVRALNGPDAGSTTLYWDDVSSLDDTGTRSCRPTQLDGTAGVDSSGGVHGWTCPDISGANANDGVNGGWGDVRWIDDWTYQTVDAFDETEIATTPLPQFVCTPSAPAYLFQYPTGAPPTQVYSVDMTTGSSGAYATLEGRTINGVAFNPLDDYIYGYDSTGGEFVRIGADGSVQGLGLPAGFVPPTNPSGINMGEFDAQGRLWAGAGGAGSTTLDWYQIDLAPGADFAVLSAGSQAMPSDGALADWAFSVTDEQLYSIARTAGLNTRLMRFDPATGTLHDEGDLGILTAPNGVVASNAFGAVYADAAGYIYGSNNATGQIWRIDPASAQADFFSYGPASGLNDGARCFNAPISIDFGDAPDTFGTMLSGDGPRHAVPGYDDTTKTAPVMLGASIDIETDGQPSAAADADGADEDGVVFNPGEGYSTPTIMTGMLDPVEGPAVSNTLRVTASAAGFVSVWVDWNLDGDFLDADEQVANAQAVAAGGNDVTFSRETSPSGTETYVRVRYSTDRASLASPTGAAPDGEVEDYLVTVVERLGVLDDWKTVDPVSGSTVQPGQAVTYTLHFENTGDADVTVDRDDVLTAVLDDATVTGAPTSSDPALSVSAIAEGRFNVSGTLAPGQVVTVTYTVTVNPDGERGDDRLGNFLVDRDAPPPVECVPTDQQRPDCTISHVSNVVVSKAANPKSGAEVSQGQQVAYTLTFENVSTNSDAADAPVDYTDHLVDVLDDATLTAGPVSSNPSVTAARAGDTIRVTGAVSSGDTVTVTYTVTVKAYDRQGNHHLGNVIAQTGTDPICAPGSKLCTWHELVPSQGLASTGVTPLGSVMLAALILLAGGGALLIGRRRHTTATTDSSR